MLCHRPQGDPFLGGSKTREQLSRGLRLRRGGTERSHGRFLSTGASGSCWVLPVRPGAAETLPWKVRLHTGGAFCHGALSQPLVRMVSWPRHLTNAGVAPLPWLLHLSRVWGPCFGGSGSSGAVDNPGVVCLSLWGAVSGGRSHAPLARRAVGVTWCLCLSPGVGYFALIHQFFYCLVLATQFYSDTYRN